MRWPLIGGCLLWFVASTARTQPLKAGLSCRDACPSSGNPVCGTDMRIYESRCHLKLARCRRGDQLLRMIPLGRCKGVMGMNGCHESRKRALSQQKKRLPFTMFIPECLSDGSYRPIQCLKTPRICWCVDRMGSDIKGTRVRHANPICPTPSPSKPITVKSAWKLKRQQNYKGCPKDVRATFNTKVLKMLEKEFLAYVRRASSSGSSGAALVNNDTRRIHILMWKFNQLDTNADYFLEWRELHDLLRLTKKTIHPKKCSKTFVPYCDENQDGKISRNEWYACFGVQEIKKCIGEYLAAVRSPQQSPSGRSYLPKCQSDGSFVPTQCYPAIGYCWCVDAQSGKHIPGTTKKTNSLDCSRYAIKSGSRSGQKKQRGKKECTSKVWPTYKKHLVSIFRKEVTETKIRRSAPGQLAASLMRSQRRARSGILGAWGTFLSDNQVLAWKFHQLDANRDRLLTNREFFVASTKKSLGNVKRGRKCSKKLFADCDFGKNGGLSLNEWSYCLSNRYQAHLR